MATELLGAYRGPLLTDGYSGYKAHLKDIEKVSLAYCWAHARRKFVEIEENYPKECKAILDLMGQLFEIERKAQNYEDLLRLRQEKSTKIIDELHRILQDLHPLARPKSGLQKAINYVFNHWEGCLLYTSPSPRDRQKSRMPSSA